MVLVRLPQNIGPPMAFYVDVSSGDIDLTTISGGAMVLSGTSGNKTWPLVIVEQQSASALTLRHDFQSGDADVLGDYRCGISLTTDGGGEILIPTDTIIEIRVFP